LFHIITTLPHHVATEGKTVEEGLRTSNLNFVETL